ncbi:MAG: hypothetical protein ACK5G0_02720 [Bacteroidota bacterium]|jgi:hypothetical protein
MNWILTALIGAFLGSICWLIFYSVLRFPSRPVKIGPFIFSRLLSGWIQKSLTAQARETLLQLHPGGKIRELLQAPTTRERVIDWLSGRVQDYISNTLPQKWPMLSLLIGDKTTEKVQQALSEYLNENWDSQIEKLCHEELSDEILVARILTMELFTDSTIISNLLLRWVSKWSLRILLVVATFSALMAMAGHWLFLMLEFN